MKSVIALLAFVAAASAGNLYGGPIAYAQPAIATYAAPIVSKTVVPAAQSYAYNNRAPSARVAIASPVYAQQAYATPALATYAAPIVSKTVVPAAQSYAYNNRAPSARVAIASPVYAQQAYAAPVYAQQVATYAHAAPVTYGHQAVVHSSFSSPIISYAY